MPSDEDRDYFLKREAQERLAAGRAAAESKALHTQLADRYAALVQSLTRMSKAGGAS